MFDPKILGYNSKIPRQVAHYSIVLILYQLKIPWPLTRIIHKRIPLFLGGDASSYRVPPLGGLEDRLIPRDAGLGSVQEMLRRLL